MLSHIEITLLKALEPQRKYRVDEAASISGMKKDSVLKAAHLLQEKGLARVEITTKKVFRLTEEGKRYLEEGLPEERLVRLLKEQAKMGKVEELKKTMGKKEFGIALGWLRKKGAISVENGVVRLIKAPEFEEREALRAVAEGRAGSMVKTLLKRRLVDFEEKKEIHVTILKKCEEELREYIADITPEVLSSRSWRGKEFLKYDITIPSKEIFAAKLHPYERIIKECRKVFLEMGFTEIKGNYVQPAFWNFDALFQPQDHPARDMQDTFYLDRYVELEDEGDVVERVKETHERGIAGSTGWGGVWSIDKAKQLVMRTHTTAITIHYLAKNPEPPVKAFCIDRVYRRETIDATHLPEFDQLEGVVLDENVGFKDLLGLLRKFFLKMGFEDVRFRPGYFPYTEPSVEPEVYVEGLGWIELGGAGVFRKEVTEPLGIKGKVLAWGLGIGRLAMLRLGMKDLRRLYLPDIGWLRSTPVIKR